MQQVAKWSCVCYQMFCFQTSAQTLMSKICDENTRFRNGCIQRSFCSWILFGTQKFVFYIQKCVSPPSLSIQRCLNPFPENHGPNLSFQNISLNPFFGTIKFYHKIKLTLQTDNFNNDNRKPSNFSDCRKLTVYTYYIRLSSK